MQELVSGSSKHRGQQSLGVRFHIKLLSLILKDLGQEYASSPYKLYIKLNSILCDVIFNYLIIFMDFLFSSQPLNSANGKNSWLKALGQCISKSQCASKELPSDCFDSGSDGYDELDFSKKLKLLNFLCDEVLCTE